MLRVGIIGCGKIAELRHAPEYLENPNAEIAGFWCYQDVPRAESFAKRFGGRAYETVKDMLGDPTIDAISMCAANTFHAQTTVDALKMGKHVLCEKPMATTLEDCQRMADTARETGKVLMLGHNQRFAKAHVAAKEMILAGRIGRPLSFITTFGHPGPEGWTGQKYSWFFSKDDAVFGVLGDLGIHKVDLIHYLLDDPIVSVSAVMDTLDKTYPDGTKINVEDNALCQFETLGGVLGTMQVSWTYYAREDNSTRIYGTLGTLRLYDDPEYSLILETKGGKQEKLALDLLTSNKEQTTGKRTNTGVIDAFVDAVLTGRRSRIDGDEALKAMKVIFAAQEAASKGQKVQIHQV